MEYKTLLKAGVKKHRGVLTGIFLLTLLVSLSLGTVLTVWTNAGRHVRAELERAGFGTLTAWVSGVPDAAALSDEIAELDEVARTETQPLIFANYAVNSQESDSEGQLILLSPGNARYRFFTDDLTGYRTNAPEIAPGETYVSPSLISTMGVKAGDRIIFAVARNGGTVTLTVAGFYEDPFMGSAMIGMKGFLIGGEDYAAMARTIGGAGIDALAREGAMLHIFGADTANVSVSRLNSLLNQNTALPQYTEFVHSADAIAGFMLILQNAFSALLSAFVLVLLGIVLVVLGHSIGGTIEADYSNMGSLKTVGFTSAKLRRMQLLQYTIGILPGMTLGLAFSAPVSRLAGRMTLTATGILTPSNIPWVSCIAAYTLICVLLTAFISFKTAKIGRVTPMMALCGEAQGDIPNVKGLPAIRGGHVSVCLAARQLLTGKKKYLSACLVALLLVFFASVIGRMNVWLGADGKGMMDAFNPADHDIGVQLFGAHTDEEAREIVVSYTDITASYLLAMPGVAVNGIDYTANVISEPARFHLLEGKTCAAASEIVVTESAAADLGVSIGDTLTVTGDGGSGQYTVSGIYACANDMGANLGMSREGYLKIGRDDPRLWCHHYFLRDPSQNTAVTEALNAAFGGDVHVHEITWPGLFGIIAAMRALIAFLYTMAALFILIVTIMTGDKLLAAERRDIGIYKALGFTDRRLRFSFALRFGMAAALGSTLGAALATVLTDPLVSSMMKLAGISNFASHPTVLQMLFPALLVTLLFTGFAYLAAGKMKRMDLAVLIAA